MQDYEKLGLFYLGKRTDVEGEVLLYDSRDLTTHAVCVGMTGSGKTGLCVTLLEEAAIDAVPALVIDPKGDLANMMLTFPALRPEDFLPWVQAEEARRAGLTRSAFAAQQAETWARGLAEWGQDGARIARLREAAEFAVYTPGSQAGLPVSVLRSFAAPPAELVEDKDLLRERIETSVQSLLGLLGLAADPLQSREHILLATILERAWSAGESLDLGALVRRVQGPPFERVGVMELETFMPAKERFELAMRLNNLLASPTFQGWLEGEPLDVQRLLYTPAGKPRVAIFCIAHLSDAERMFFVSLLFAAVLGWVRTQPGTSSLRAVLYMDEIAGFLPPTANPPSKPPLLTLLKQARAFGLGVVLSTQNPVDLDYKALSNAGTWFIGRLQTERDKQRLLDGLESARAGAGPERQELERLIASLDKRVFLLHNVHDKGPSLFRTRWALSYLRGPMTRDEISRLARTNQPQAAVGATSMPPPSAPAAPEPAASPRQAATSRPAPTADASRPALPPDIPERFIEPSVAVVPETELLYRPRFLATGVVGYSQAKPPVEHRESICLLAPFGARIDWDEAKPAELPAASLGSTPREGARFEALPAAAVASKSYAGWKRDLEDWLYRNRRLPLLQSPSLGAVSKPGETEGDFRVRLRELAREKRDAHMAQVRDKFAKQVERVQEKVRRAEAVLERENEQRRNQKTQTAISFGAALLGSILGGRKSGTVGRATTAARGVGRARMQAQDVDQARAALEAARQDLAALEVEAAAEVAAVGAALAPASEPLAALSIRAQKSLVRVEDVALAWVPFWQDPGGVWHAAAGPDIL